MLSHTGRTEPSDDKQNFGQAELQQGMPVVLSQPKAKQPIIGLVIMEDQSSITLMSPHAVQPELSRTK